MMQEENKYYKEKFEKTEKALSQKVSNEKGGEKELEKLYPTYKNQKELSKKLDKFKGKEQDKSKEKNKNQENEINY